MDRNTIDARSARIALAMYLRWLWLPALALVAGLIVGDRLSTEEGPGAESSATLTIGLTEEVRWPFFDAVLARQQGIVENGDLEILTTASTGIDVTSVEVAGTNVQNSTMTVTVTVSGSSADAQIAADDIGDRLVAQNLASLQGNELSTIEGIRAEIAETQAEAAAYELQITELNDQWVLLQDEIIDAEPEDVAELRGASTEVDSDRRALQRRLDGLIGLETTLSTQLTQLEIAAAQTGAPIEVSAGANAISTSATDLRPVFAVLFFLLALIAVPFAERAFGRIRSLDHLGSMWPDAKLVDVRNRRLAKGTINPIDVARLAVRADAHDAMVGVAGLSESPVTEWLADALQAQGTDARVIDLSSTEGMESVVATKRLAIVVPTGRIRLRRAIRAAANLHTLSADPVVLLLASQKPKRPTSMPAPVVKSIDDETDDGLDNELLDEELAARQRREHALSVVDQREEHVATPDADAEDTDDEAA